MTGRERFLAALNNQKPDRLPCQVHSWMDFYLRTYLDGRDQWQAYEFLEMDPVVYVLAPPIFDESDLANWQQRQTELGTDADGVRRTAVEIETPGGTLTMRKAANDQTGWITEHLIKSERDFEIWSKYVPVPVDFDQRPWAEAKERVGDRGIVRAKTFNFGQGAAWQDLCGVLMDTQETILAAIDRPDWVEHMVADITAKRVGMWQRVGRLECDIVECGGGAGSSTVISPALHERFCLPYDRAQHAALHEAGGVKVVYHLCGGLMPLLELAAANGADGLETMTPPSMGGDCDLAEASRRIGERRFFIGGFDQNAGFVRGTPEGIRQQVRRLHAACPDGGYICSPSDHFFHGDPENVRQFARCCRECTY